MSIVTILSILVSSMIVYAAPLIFTSIGGAYSEHAGVVNVGLEGIMVMGAFSGIIFNLTFEPALGSLTPWLSLIVAAGIGVLFSLIHAVATIHFRADHIPDNPCSVSAHHQAVIQKFDMLSVSH